MAQSDADLKIVREARKRFDAARTYETRARSYFLQDYRFANGDARNLYQWDQNRRNERDATQRPYLTINKTRQHNLQIINDMKQNKPGITIKPTSGDASYESAQVMQDLIRHIEYKSNATLAYDLAASFQVQAGWGYWRVKTDYVSPTSFDQEILIEPIQNPLSVYIDPYARMPDKSDMRFGFIFEDIARDELDTRYPEYDDQFPVSAFGNTDSGWITADTVRVCEYFRVKETKDTIAVNTETGAMFYRSEVAGPLWQAMTKPLQGDSAFQTRPTMRRVVEWFFIIGDEIKERNIWPGKYVPIVKVVGEEFIIDNVFDCRGHTRALLDPQKMYNFMSSSAVEYGALQTKIPWLVPIEAVEEYEDLWKNANTLNYSYLPYKSGLDSSGQPMPPPQRIEAPMSAPMALQGMQVAAAEMQMVSGQFDANMGEKGNERSGIAIDKRQRKGDNATYHYIDNQAVAIAYTGKIILDIIPAIYDTPRVLQIIGEDGETAPLQIDPQQAQALAQEEKYNGEVVTRSLNPKIGQYEVQSQVGPLFATRRQAAFDAFTLIMTQAPQLTSIIGDIMMKSADFPLANEAAKRLKNMVPGRPWASARRPEEAQLQDQLTQAQQMIRDLMDKIAIMDSQLVRNAGKTVVDQENAKTARLKVLLDSGIDEKQFRMEAARLVMDADMHDIEQENERARVEIERMKAKQPKGAS
jgi:hypothetical protein